MFWAACHELQVGEDGSAQEDCQPMKDFFCPSRDSNLLRVKAVGSREQRNEASANRSFPGGLAWQPCQEKTVQSSF